ncbi:DUF1775 domain-containing protein [Streptomyces ferrugineus]|uniref:DUF1775 domain-containing protein n=1 Tax=Streptomyces ferrugineus TaxID=1413221 RepID=A0A7M2SE44_9ACTN|nr:DUF1775 domain-containing protein [Streptomyces ferrugineus]QOV34582.1 DUF1775 domain-containing protein [Streptomyces ferrugineus]
MSVHTAARTAGPITLTFAAALTATLSLAAPAYAHAEVEADTPRALAENVTLTFVSEAESATAGFTGLRVVLPEGITPGDVTLADAPKGWKLKTTGDGYTVAGPVLKTGVDARYKVRVRQLPDAGRLVFKTLETYSDGEVARWIELPGGDVEPEQPAPVLQLEPASSGADSSGPSPATSSAPAAATDARPAGKTAGAQEDGASTGPVAGSAVAGLLVLGAGAWWLARRRASGASETPTADPES